MMTSLDNNQENIEPDNRKELEVNYFINFQISMQSNFLFVQAQMDYEASRRRRRGDAYIQESQQNTDLRNTESREAKLVVDRNCNASVVNVEKLQNEVDKSPKRRASRRQVAGEEQDQAARASTGDLGTFGWILTNVLYEHEHLTVAGEVMTVNMSGRPMSTPTGIGNDNQKRARDPEAETTPELPSPRVRDGMTEYDGSVYSYDVTRAGSA